MDSVWPIAATRLFAKGIHVKHPLPVAVGLICAALIASVASSASLPFGAAVRSSNPPRLPPAAAAGETVFYGHIQALTRKRGHYELRFDPAWWLSGTAAERAAVADKVIKPGEAVPNDYYVVDSDHRLLTFLVAADARVTVLDQKHLPRSVAVSLRKLAQLVRAGTRQGFWIRVGAKDLNPVVAFDQQYQP
jgi:hypothetical protein